jgi:hypothetical protein
MDENTYEIKLNHCQIRANKALKSKSRVETPWKVEIGVFREYLKERGQKLINDCFEQDWKEMK